MGRTKKRKEIWTPSKSPAQRVAAKITKKYKSPHKNSRRALYQVFNKELSIRKAAKANDISFSSLQRRTSGQVAIEKGRGPKTIFNKSEEETMARYLSEMAQRGMGLRPTEFLDFVENLMKKDKREKRFKDGRPSWDWYYGFMNRNSHIIQKRNETSLEISRAKVTIQEMDDWFNSYNIFMSDNHLLDKPERVYNADETGFTMGSKSGQVIGPAKRIHKDSVPHVTGGRSKERVTVMYCANAEGTIIPPFFVYSKPKPTSFDLLAGSHRQARAEFTDKGWMDAETFRKFIQHLHTHAVKDRPIVLLIDSVGSHVDMESFSCAKELGIEIYRLVRNATHLMQPLDVGVYGRLKKSWYKHLRLHSRQHPDDMVKKQNFARHLQVAFMDFYKPITVQKSFASSGVFPVNRSAISNNRLKPSLTYEEKVDNTSSIVSVSMLEDAPSTSRDAPATSRDAPSTSRHAPSTSKDAPSTSRDDSLSVVSADDQSGLEILAQAAMAICEDPQESTPLPLLTNEELSPHILSAINLPTVKTKKLKRKSFADELPDNLTSEEGIRVMGLKSLEKAKSFATKEKKAKEKFLKSKEKTESMSKQTNRGGKKIRSTLKTPKTTHPLHKNRSSCTTTSTSASILSSSTLECCFVCSKDESEPAKWSQCDFCKKWEHIACIPTDHSWNKDAVTRESVEFKCQLCTSVC